MNKILISILLVATLFSCTKNSYTLRGTAESADLNGAVISVGTFDDGKLNVIGEVTVENQKFVFKGIVEEPTKAFLSFIYPEGYWRGQTFILENAEINFNITDDMKIEVSGRSILQLFDKEMTNLIPREVMDSLRSGLFSEAEWLPRREYYDSKRQRLVIDFSTKNVNTAEGTFAFVDNYRILPLENQIAILDLMNETTRNNPQIQEVAQQVEAEMRVTPGKMYLDFTLPTPAGEMLSLSDVVGNHDYVLLHFWASWCGPCIHSFPEMTNIYREHAGKSFEIFSVSVDEDEAAWKGAIEQHNLAWHHVSSLKGRKCEVPKFYGIR